VTRGGCLCGGVRFEIARAVGPFELCHCPRCRKASGSAFAALVGVRTADFRLLQGSEWIERYDAPILEAPPAYRRSFCRRCGSPVPDPPPGAAWFEIPAGLLEGDPGVHPDRHIFVEHRAPWFEPGDALPRLTKAELRALRREAASDRAYRVRPARPEDLALLPAIERRAAERFAGHPIASGFGAETTPEGMLRDGLAAGRLWVAASGAGEVVGFALASVVGGEAHLQEVDVLPEHGRRGVGRALVEAVCAWARGDGFAAVTLTTLADVPWNAPYYEKLGFRRLSVTQLTPSLRARLADEAQRGLGAETRVAMRRQL
jgi:GNAT superfamily N-acetyltransferase